MLSQAVKLFALRNLKKMKGPKIIIQDPVFFHIRKFPRERAPVCAQIIRHFRAAQGDCHFHGTCLLRFQGEIRQNLLAERGFGGDLDLLRQRNVSAAVICLAGALILSRYNEEKILGIIVPDKK